MPTASPARRPNLFWELALITILYGIYRLGRLAADADLAEAFANAARVWDWERAVHLPSEASVQASILHSRTLQKLANTFYSSVHFPATVAFLVWMFRRHPAHYVWMRRVLTLLTGAALILHLLFPLAPPRMMPSLGFADTGRLVGPSPYGPIDTDGLANQFAAMPSLHVGWALLVAIGLIAAGRGRWRWLWLLHPALTLMVVVVTANHYWLDAIAAVLLLVAALLLVRRPPADRPPSGRERPSAGTEPSFRPRPRPALSADPAQRTLMGMPDDHEHSLRH